MAYELFERKSVRSVSPQAAIAPGGRIILNAAAARLLLEAGAKFVVLFWDKSKKKMAIKGVQKSSEHSFAITFMPNEGLPSSGSITAKSFLQHIEWNALKREQLPTTWNASDRMFELSLPVQYLGSGRKNTFI
jgi:hypothetical protein